MKTTGSTIPDPTPEEIERERGRIIELANRWNASPRLAREAGVTVAHQIEDRCGPVDPMKGLLNAAASYLTPTWDWEVVKYLAAKPTYGLVLRGVN